MGRGWSRLFWRDSTYIIWPGSGLLSAPMCIGTKRSVTTLNVALLHWQSPEQAEGALQFNKLKCLNLRIQVRIRAGSAYSIQTMDVNRSIISNAEIEAYA